MRVNGRRSSETRAHGCDYISPVMVTEPKPPQDEWVKAKFHSYDARQPGASFAVVMKERFRTPQLRQAEIEEPHRNANRADQLCA